jgi:hypothetical protein
VFISPADIDGQGSVRIDGGYLADVLKACGGMVDFKLTNAYSPMLFTADGYQVVVMPMMTSKAEAEQKEATAQAQAKPEAEVEAEPTEPSEAEAKQGNRTRYRMTLG